MEGNHYQAPGAPVLVPGPTRSVIASALIWFLIYMVASLLVGTLIGIVAGALLALGGGSEAEVEQAFQSDNRLYLIYLLIGTLLTFWAARRAARRANHREYHTVLIFLAVSMLAALAMALVWPELYQGMPAWYLWSSHFLALPAVLLAARVQLASRMRLSGGVVA
ncbi:MAG: hypothetical protein KAG82_11530 [Alcanivoracaceae bacterium]|nr:hypothetical protein [Alcanivoracaceae bacterium]